MLPQYLTHRFLQNGNIVFFKPLVKKLRGHLNGQHITFSPYRLNRLKPCVEILFVYILFDDLETISPDASSDINFHRCVMRFSCQFFLRGDKGVKKLKNKK